MDGTLGVGAEQARETLGHRVGVIGGGQLAWMMAAAVRRLGLELRVQTPALSDPAVAIATETIVASVQDVAGTAQLATQSDVITFENEFVDLLGLQGLADQGVRFLPSLGALAPLLDKADQRVFLRDRGLPGPRFVVLAEVPEPERPIWQNPFGFPVVLKARRLGYDGQGTSIVQDETVLAAILAERGFEPFLLEEFVPFERELAMMVARGQSGEVVVYSLVETEQQNQVCRWVLVPAIADEALYREAERIGRSLVEGLDFVGIMGVELFERAGELLINEIAPRTHNSGHYSLDVCETSQFEQQLRAVCGFPLGSAALTAAGAVMVNLLGYEVAQNDYRAQRQRLAAIPGATVYWYGKSEARPGRKLGHVTLRLEQSTPEARRKEAIALVEQVERLWRTSADG